jgi:hypothetical protein
VAAESQRIELNLEEKQYENLVRSGQGKQCPLQRAGDSDQPRIHSRASLAGLAHFVSSWVAAVPANRLAGVINHWVCKTNAVAFRKCS